MARPPIQVELSKKERKFLRAFVSKGTREAREIRRAQILLLADEGQDHASISQLTKAGRQTIWRIKKRYVAEGLESALKDKPRSGGPKKYTAYHEAEIIALACTSPPPGRDHWSIRLIVEELQKRKGFESIQREKVRLVLKKARQSRGARRAGA